MSAEENERWMDRFRRLAKDIQAAEYTLIKREAQVKKLQAQHKVSALGSGIKTSSAQETYAESQEDLYLARLEIGVAKGALSAARVELKALEVGFEEWRTRSANKREEMKRYGA